MSSILPKNYGYVFGVLGGSVFMNMYLMVNVAKARKEFKVEYPNLYAPHGHENKEQFDRWILIYILIALYIISFSILFYINCTISKRM